jgi:NAD(P)-dependent dehydrogenase (short-subunit alcohol dehydrogenase family)
VNAEGRVAIVTGGASGIGSALARRLSADGADVWVADRRLEPAREVVAGLGPRAHAIELDVRDPASFAHVVDEVVQQSGRLDFLFNNAGIGVGAEVDSHTLEDWNDVIDVNLRGVVHGIHAAYPVMIRQHGGHIVNTASMAGLMTSGGQASYSATKHAVVALSRSLRVEADRHGVQVSVLCPGVVRTPIFTGGAFGRMDAPGMTDAQIVKAFWEPLRPMDPDVFARRALRCVYRGDDIIVVPWWWKSIWYLERLSPALSLRLAKLAMTGTRRVRSSRR